MDTYVPEYTDEEDNIIREIERGRKTLAPFRRISLD